MITSPQLIEGGIFTDDRGTIRFVNDFDLDVVKRFYIIDHPQISVTRAWQGHKLEQKWFYVIRGSFTIMVVQPDDWQTPNHDLPVTTYLLTAEKSQILHLPGGIANGIKASIENSQMIVFSNFTIDQSKNDEFRFSKDYFTNYKVHQ